MEGHKRIFAISGVKNSGKTTLITELLPVFTSRGLAVATIKHDGHDFQADVPGTDSFRHFAAGAVGSAVFSEQRVLMVRRQTGLTADALAAFFPEADLILLEGLKASCYPKLEVIRRGNSAVCVCGGHNLKAIVTDLRPDEIENLPPHLPVFSFCERNRIADLILEQF